jgi:N utilization substance protein A
MKALAPAKVKEVQIDYDTGTAKVIVPDFQLSLAIGKEGQNARLAHRLVGLRVDIVSETQMAENGGSQPPAADWAEGEWVTDAETGEQMWQPADGGPALSAAEWQQGGPSGDAPPAAEPDADADAEPVAGAGDPAAGSDESSIADEEVAEEEVADAIEGDTDVPEAVDLVDEPEVPETPAVSEAPDGGEVGGDEGGAG